MEVGGKAEYCIEHEVGCGAYQAIFFVLCILGVHIASGFTTTVMAFGNYNPGWRCLDNSSMQSDVIHNVIDNVISNVTSSSLLDVIVEGAERGEGGGVNQSSEYKQGSCQAFKECRRVEFDPASVTVVTEWSLICDQYWMTSVAISVQMAGMLLGSLVSGQMADWFGRKMTLYACVAMGACLQLVSAFSVSWLMFTINRFFLGMCAVSLLSIGYLFMSEVFTIKWRAAAFALPDFQLGVFLMAVMCTVLKHWRHVEMAGFVFYALTFLPVFWIPESLRWLEVKNKTGHFNRAANKMAKVNKRVVNDDANDDYTFDNPLSLSASTNNDTKPKRYTILDLCRVGYRFRTFALSFVNFIYILIYYALTFGVKAMLGDFYTNLLVFNSIQIPSSLIAFMTIKYLKRRTNSVLYLVIFIINVWVIAGVMFVPSENLKATLSTILIPVAQGCINGACYVCGASIAELYPTVVRGVSYGWIIALTRLGAIFAPFFIPRDQDSFYIYMLAMGGIALVCAAICLRLPETKGKPLTKTFPGEELGDEGEDDTKNGDFAITEENVVVM